MVEAIELAPFASRAMAIGLHTTSRTLTRSYSSSMFGIKQIPLLFRVAATTEPGGVGLPAWSLAGQLALNHKPDTVAAPEQCSCGLALTREGAYNEEAFRYLLDVERKRFEVSSQPFMLVLVESVRRPGHTDRMPPAVAARIFATLRGTLRDTDVIGWYREGRIIGAVLTHLGDVPLAESTRPMSARVRRALADHLSADTARHLKVRLYRPRVELLR